MLVLPHFYKGRLFYSIWLILGNARGPGDCLPLHPHVMFPLGCVSQLAQQHWPTARQTRRWHPEPQRPSRKASPSSKSTKTEPPDTGTPAEPQSVPAEPRTEAVRAAKPDADASEWESAASEPDPDTHPVVRSSEPLMFPMEDLPSE